MDPKPYEARFRLRLLGVPDLRDHEGRVVQSVVAQPKRLALLTYLAIAQSGEPIARDRLLALFWPEADESRARNSLSQALSYLRRSLGDDVLLASNEAVELGPGSISSDVAELQDALAQGNPAAALSLYAGDFLDGFGSPGNPDFDDWVEVERARLRRLTVQASLASSEAAARDGAWDRAVEAATRGLEIVPTDESVARALIRALARQGARSDILAAYEALRSRLDRELGIEPSPETRALVERIRADPEPPAAHMITEVREADLRSSSRSADSVQVTAREASPPRGRTAFRARYARPRMIAMVGVTAAAAGVLLSGLPGRDDPSFDRDLVQVPPFVNESGDPRLAHIGTMAAEVMAEGLSRTGLVRVLSAHDVVVAGLRPGSNGHPGGTAPRLLLSGRYYPTGSGIRLFATLEDREAGTLIASFGQVALDEREVRSALEELRQRTLGAVAMARDPEYSSDPTAVVNPPRYEAYSAFSRARSAEFAQRWEEAAELYRQALERDSSFLIARMRSLRPLAVLDLTAARVVAQDVMRDRDLLSPADRAYADGMVAQLSQDPAGWYRGVRRAAELAPRRYLFEFARAANYRGRWEEAVQALELLGITPDDPFGSYPSNYYAHEITSLHRLGRWEEALAATRRWQSVSGGSLTAWEAGILGHLGRVDELRAVVEEARRDNRGPALARVMQLGANGLDAAGRHEAARALREEILATLENVPVAERDEAAQVAAGALVMLGREEEARSLLETILAGQPEEEEARRLLGIVAARLGDREEALAQLDWFERRPSPDLFGIGTNTLAASAIWAALGERARAVANLQHAQAEGLNMLLVHGRIESGFRDILDDPGVAYFLTPQPPRARQTEPLRLSQPVR